MLQDCCMVWRFVIGLIDFCLNTIFFTYSQPGPSFINLLIQYAQSDLPPHRPLCGEAPGRDSKPGTGGSSGMDTNRPPHLTQYNTGDSIWLMCVISKTLFFLLYFVSMLQSDPHNFTGSGIFWAHPDPIQHCIKILFALTHSTVMCLLFFTSTCFSRGYKSSN